MVVVNYDQNWIAIIVIFAILFALIVLIAWIAHQSNRIQRAAHPIAILEAASSPTETARSSNSEYSVAIIE